MTRTLRRVLAALLPDPVDAALLRSCLATGDAFGDAWETFRSQGRDLIDLFRTDRGELKRLGPLLHDNLRRNGAQAEPRLLTVLRTAYLREELRSRVYLGVISEGLEVLEITGVDAIVLGGAALGEWAYGDPALRHSHDIDFLVHQTDLARSVDALARRGFLRQAPSEGDPHGDVVLIHPSSLPVRLSGSLFALSCHPRALDELWSHSRMVTVAGRSARVLSPEDNLAHVLGRASYSAGRASLQWACDAWMILARSAALDSGLLMAAFAQSRIGLPAVTMLGFLKNIGAPVPSTLSDAAERHVSGATTFERDLALNGLRLGARGGLARVLRALPEWRSRGAFAWWVLFPSPEYVRWTQQPPGNGFLPARYVARAISGVIAVARAVQTPEQRV